MSTTTKACPSHKRRHPDEQTAIAAALRCSRRGTPLRVYRCPECKGWHLTKQARRS